MHPLLRRVANAYHPLAGRNRLVEGPHQWPPAGSTAPRRRVTLLALLAALGGRNPCNPAMPRTTAPATHQGSPR